MVDTFVYVLHQVMLQSKYTFHSNSWVESHAKYATASAMLQEVLSPGPSALRHRSAMLGNSAENCEFRIQVFPQAHNRRNIPAPITIIRCTPYGYHRPVFEVVLVAFVDQLVCACYQLQAVDMIELQAFRRRAHE